jgi:ATP-dependent DNA ligase I
MTASLFRLFAGIAQQLAETRRTSEKVQLCAAYLRKLGSDTDLDLAVRYLGEGAFSTVSGKRAAIGHRTIAICAAQYLEIDYEMVFRPSRIATGSASETIEKLMENLDVARSKRHSNVTLSLKELDERFQRLATLRKREEKEAFLMEVWRDLSPTEVKYFLRILGGGSLRIGFESRSLLNAIAIAFDADPEAVRYTHMITGSVGKTAVMARNRTLDDARFRLFQPVAFMLASPYEAPNAKVQRGEEAHNEMARSEEIRSDETLHRDQADNGKARSDSVRDYEPQHNTANEDQTRSVQARIDEPLADYLAEEKFDGMRCQLHTDGSRVMLYSRDLNDISASFPEIVDGFATRTMPPTVLDGEICVFFDDTIQPFQLLQKRMGVKKPTPKLLKSYPVTFIAYDMLYTGNRPLFSEPLYKRRALLEQVCREWDIPVVRQFDVHSVEDVDRLFEQAVTHGNEGLILKKRDSVYEFGQRRKSWIKVKRPGGSLDTVILYATAGSGKRGGTYSDYTLGIRVQDDSRFDQSFVPIGKAYGGYTDDELKRLNTAIKPLIRERFGPTLSLEPKIVVEIEFDEIQVNRRTKAGYTLRLPRFRAIRWDKGPADTDTIAEVERLYNEKQTRERHTQTSFQQFDQQK